MLKKQLQKVEIKSDMLEKKLGLFRAKKQKSSQQLGKFLPGMKNQTQLSMYRKIPESSTKANKKNKRPVASLAKNIAPEAHLSLAKNTQKQNYALVDT